MRYFWVRIFTSYQQFRKTQTIKNTMKLIKFLIIATFIFPTTIFGQNVPVLKSTTNLLSIKEGQSMYKNIWQVNPKAKKDVFVTNPFKNEKSIIFYSDIDTIAFNVVPNKEYNFIVLLNGKKAKTQINTSVKLEPSLIPQLFYTNALNPNSKRDTIPFQIGKDNCIYVKGRINKSDTLDFLLDLNAGTNAINKRLVANQRVPIKIDGKVKNGGSDGVMMVETSAENVITINNLTWKDVPLLIIPYGESPIDAILSWVSFKNKILEIDYDHNLLIIHNELPKSIAEYSALKMKMIGGIPYVECELSTGDKTVKGWFGFDTGGNADLIVSQKFASKNHLNNSMKQIAKAEATGSSGVNFDLKIVRLPKFKIGEYELYRIPLAIYEKDPEGVKNNEILGNNILKRFNSIVDFKNNMIYIKPSKLLYSPMD